VKRVLLPLILLVVASVAVFVWHQATAEADSLDDTATTVHEPEADPGGTMTGDPALPAAGRGDATQEADDETSRQELPNEAAAQPTVTLRGRCVFAGSTRPIAGCRVVVGGWPAGRGRMDDYLKEHPPVVWKHPPHQTTGGDGRFVVSFVPPPPYQYYISIDTLGLATMYGRWRFLRPGVKDLGDIAIPPGSRVTGRVVDEAGVPQAGASVNLHREGSQPMPRGIMFAEHSFDRSTRDDGYFELNTALVAGKWYPDVTGRQVITPRVLEIPAQTGDRQVLIKVKARANLPAITGTVFDDAGRPVAKAQVRAAQKTKLFGMAGRGAKTESQKDGTFRIECERGPSTEPVTLLVSREGHEPLITTEKHTWGTEGVVLRMQRGVAVELLVVDAVTAQPITDYAVRCFPNLGKDYYSPRARLIRESLNGRLHLQGPHQNGVLKIRGLVTGEHLLMVSPTTTRHAQSGFHRFQVAQGTPRQVVRLEPLPGRILEVVSKSGDPIAGTKVEVVYSSAGKKANLWARHLDLAKNLPFGDFFQVLQTSVTDAAGKLELVGPPREKLAVRLNGPGHVPVVVNDVVLADGGPLRVVVEVGATVLGRTRPVAVLKDLTADPATLNQHSLKAVTPGFRLTREAGGPVMVMPRDHNAGFPIAADGSFEIQNIPAGTWKLQFKYLPRLQSPWPRPMRVKVKTINDLKEGETRRVDVDLAFLVAATLTGTAFVNGRPLKKGSLVFHGKEPAPSSQTIQTGEDGSFRLRSVAGEFEIFALVPPRGKGPFVTLFPGLPLTLTPAASRQQDLRFHHGQLRLRVLASDGKTPVAGAKLACATEDGNRAVYIRGADASGQIHMDVFPQGSFVVTVWPKHLAKPMARHELMRKNPRGWRKAAITVGTLQVAPGEPTTKDLILPAASGY